MQERTSNRADSVLEALTWLSRELGRSDRDCVILAEGNTSAALPDRTFLVKASGARLEDAEASDFVHLRLDPLRAFLDDESDQDVGRALRAARRDERVAGDASIEVFVHVACLTLGKARVVAHTHPTAMVGLLSGSRSRELVTSGPLFPDEAVVCGALPLYVEYHPPGIELGRAVHRGIREHSAAHGQPPRLILLENHGVVALGSSAADALAITEMAAKAARVRICALVAGGLRPLREDGVAALVRRSDERARAARLAGIRH